LPKDTEENRIKILEVGDKDDEGNKSGNRIHRAFVNAIQMTLPASQWF